MREIFSKTIRVNKPMMKVRHDASPLWHNCALVRLFEATPLRRVRLSGRGVLKAIQKINCTLRVGSSGEDGSFVVLQYL